MAGPPITLLTDFGNGSPYVAAMKGVILTRNPAAVIVDLTHAIRAQDVRQGAWTLGEVIHHFPPATIHVAVVDPGVGTARALVYAEFGAWRFVGPDNGLFSRVARQHALGRVVRLENPVYWQPQVSATFHGRDIMAPVAARLSLGLAPELLGPPHPKLIELQWPEADVVPGKVTGQVVAIDSFGNLVTNITASQLASAPTGEELQVTCDEHETRGLFRAYGDQPDMTLIALVGSSGHLELAIVGDSAALMLGVTVGTEVTVAW